MGEGPAHARSGAFEGAGGGLITIQDGAGNQLGRDPRRIAAGQAD